MRAPLIAFAVALAPLAAAPAASAGTIDAGVVVFGSVAERGSSEKLDSFRTDSRDTGLHDLSGEAVDIEMQARAGAEAAFATGPTTGGERLTASGRSSARSGTPTPRESDATSNLTAQFTQGKGDVALAYENEAIAAQKAGEKVDYVIPKDTIQIQTPIATTTDASTTAQDFVKWLYTPEAQQIWADNGYRPVVKSVLDKNAKEFPTPPGLFTIDKLGGWDEVTTKFFDENNGIVTKDEQDLGVSTSG